MVTVAVNVEPGESDLEPMDPAELVAAVTAPGETSGPGTVVEVTAADQERRQAIWWYLLAAGLLLWVSRRFQKQLKPGMVFAGWMVLAGIGRFLIEFFRPDQPRIPGTPLSYSAVVSLLMALVGGLWLLARGGKLNLPLLARGPEKYQEAKPAGKTR